MAPPSPNATPPLLRIGIDDVGEFLLVVVDGVRETPAQPLAKVRLRHDETLTGGAHWFAQLEGAAEEQELGGSGLSSGISSGIFSGGCIRPRESSPCAILQVQGAGTQIPEGGLLLLPVGKTNGLGIERGSGPFQVEDLEHPIEAWADADALHVSCRGGIRFAQDSGDYDGAQPTRALPWSTQGTQHLWIQARQGAPLFVTLEIWSG